MVDSPYADEMVVKRHPPLVPHEERPLSEMDRDIIGRAAVRLEMTLESRYQVRRELEVWAGAIQRALAATHQPEWPERLVLLSVRETLAGARLRTSRRFQGVKPGTAPVEAAKTDPQDSQPPPDKLRTHHR